MSTPLWQPSPEQIEQSNLYRFKRQIEQKYELSLANYQDLHNWTVANAQLFWKQFWSFADVIASDKGGRVVENEKSMPGARWFPDAKLNFAENLLRRRDDEPAIIFQGEDQARQQLSFAELYDEVASLALALRLSGVASGDRVVGFVPNTPQAIIAMLAASSIGAVWSSCSPDFGVQGVLDRFGQIEPTVLFTADAYYYNGKTHDCLEKIAQIREKLPTLEKVVVFSYVRDKFEIEKIANAVLWDDFIAPHELNANELNPHELNPHELDNTPTQIEFAQLPFNHPLYIMYSSGTTGVPKCIVHGAGGTLLQHLKEHCLHVDIKPGDRLFYFTTCGWMMWNWLVTGLASEATVMLYDGSPFYPNANALFDFAEENKINVFGTSAKFIDAANKADANPIKTHNLSAMRTILSTGSPLVPEGFDYVYTHIKKDLCLSSVSGGTDILSCFVIGSSTLPVYQGEIQCPSLGMDVQVLNEEGDLAPVGERGELACLNSFPSMPIGFWNDDDGEKYHAAYFAKFPGKWCQGDYMEKTEQNGYIIYGRSDATLNPGGVRIGTAEIYRQAEQLEEVVESLVIEQQWQGDTRVVLFVYLREGLELDAALIHKIKQQIRTNTTPRHVPAKVIQVADIPRTKSGKIVELAVRKVVHGETVKNKEALANPEALEYFSSLDELNN